MMLNSGQSLQRSMHKSLKIPVSVGLGNHFNSVDDIMHSFETAT